MAEPIKRKRPSGIDGLFTLKANERGALVIFDKNNVQLPGIVGIKIDQDLDKMKVGVAYVTLEIICKVEPKPLNNETI